MKINLFNPQHGEYIKAKTESFVVGKDPNMVNKLFETLAGKTQPDDNIENASQEFRSGLVLSLMYKFLMTALKDSLPDSKKSGTKDLRFLRHVQQGSQE